MCAPPPPSCVRTPPPHEPTNLDCLGRGSLLIGNGLLALHHLFLGLGLRGLTVHNLG